jgi:hypothetical protein
MGEFQAVLRLSDRAKESITPLIEVPEIGYDFETGTPSKTIDEHLDPFPKRVRDKWGPRACFIDLSLIGSGERMSGGQHPAEFLFDRLRTLSCFAVPVTGLDRDSAYQSAITRIVSADGNGLCVRLEIRDAAKSDLKQGIDRLLKTCILKTPQCDLLIDLGAPSFEPIEGFAKLIVTIAKNLPYRDRWRTLSLCATSFPSSMAGVKQGTTLIPRQEWQLYRRVVELLANEGSRLPTFGDYAVNYPDVLPQDMRLLKPSATIRYTTRESWLIVKGTNVRDNKYEQYRDLCKTVVESKYFAGSDFSFGDEYIAQCAAGNESTGNLTTWRKVGTNHHVERVLHDVSSLFGS